MGSHPNKVHPDAMRFLLQTEGHRLYHAAEYEMEPSMIGTKKMHARKTNVNLHANPMCYAHQEMNRPHKPAGSKLMAMLPDIKWILIRT
jgi:hypothetical protein